jgi:hypothetical protein|tara:strand:+ start:99 stop:497 length:399 start_codon:yes stop_codon:yes gene_type:complete
LTDRINKEEIVIDPVAMKIVNRIAPGSKFSGTLECSGGLFVEGEFSGTAIVTGGPLVLMQTGVMRGSINCDQNAFLFGEIGALENGDLSELECHGAAFMTETLRAKANITAGSFKSYDGFEVEGRIKTIKRS